MEGIKAAKARHNDDAEALYRQALRLHEEVLGAGNPAISESLNQLIFFCNHCGQRAETEALIEHALSLLRQKPGPEHRGILQELDGLASRCRERRQYEEAEWYYQRVLAARKELLGQNHLRVAERWITMPRFSER